MISVPMPVILLQMQSAYKEKLRQIRREQIQRADENAAKAKHRWLAYLQARQWRRDQLCKGMCDDCGYKPCACKRLPTRLLLVSLLRRCAGINPRSMTKQARTPDTFGWTDGKDGPRVVGVASWDNAIRALDEDR